MTRNTKTTINDLKPGDRFYKFGDKKKEVFEKVDPLEPVGNWAVEAKYMSLPPDRISVLTKLIRFQTEVIFLRSTNE